MTCGQLVPGFENLRCGGQWVKSLINRAFFIVCEVPLKGFDKDWDIYHLIFILNIHFRSCIDC